MMVGETSYDDERLPEIDPAVFGKLPDHIHGEPYPEIPEDERLFDRQKIAGIITEDG